MKIDLTDTTSSKINQALMEARHAIGAATVGMVLTLVIVTDEGSAYDALKAASDASHEHPSRILAVIKRPGRSPRARAEARLDAEVRVGSDSGSGETVVLRVHGELAQNAHSVVLPLLLPDAPVVVWWPDNAPDDPARDALGSLATRRITDAVSAADPVDQINTLAEAYSPGDTDLSWTRITPWRSMLAAALDQHPAPVRSAVVEGESYNPSTELLALWLAQRLGVTVRRTVSGGPGITAVRLDTADGEVCLNRNDGLLATLSMPSQPDRMVALKRRDTAELIAEELRRLDPDDTYAAAVRYGLSKLHAEGPRREVVEAPDRDPAPADAGDGGASGGAGDGGQRSAAKKAPAKAPAKTAAKAPAKTAAKAPAKTASKASK